MTAPTLGDLRFTAASAADAATGLLGWVTCTYGDLALDGITLRRTADRRLVLSFPVREDGAGRRHPVFRPVDEAARAAITSAILQGLNMGQGARS